MNTGKYVFSQIMDFVPKYQFTKCVNRFHGHYRVRKFSCWEQFLCLAFGHLTFRDSLRDIVLSLSTQQKRLYHLGFRSAIALSTLSDANRKRDWPIYRDFTHMLMQTTQAMYVESTPRSFHLDFPIYALDASLIRMCLSMFSWAKYRKTTAGLKLHTLFDLDTAIPRFIYISDGLVADNQVFKKLIFEPGALYVLDRGYFDLYALNRLVQTPAYYVLRVRKNINFKRRYSQDVDAYDQIQFDQVGVFKNAQSRKAYPHTLRLVKAMDVEQNRPIYLLSNNFSITAFQVAEIYRKRWQVELFFKWIKQHLKIQSLWGENENAVKTQIYSAIATYLIIAILRKRLRLELSMYQILQILSVTLMAKHL